MAYPDLPLTVKQMTSASNMRWRHRYWHLVKSERFVKDPANADIVEKLANIGWTAALTGEAGSGIDFLFMHRMMIKKVDEMLAEANDKNWPKVVPWAEIPKDDDDADWPEPTIPNLDDSEKWPPNLAGVFRAIRDARSEEMKTNMFRLESLFRDPEYLKRSETTLDALGHDIEVTVHNWMHMRFSALPPADPDSLDVSNDWLGDPFSSHVNPYFWKLHGWIDDCISHWETARGEEADFSGAWRAPKDAPPDNELNISSALMAAMKPSRKGALFGNVMAFVTPPEVFEKTVRRLEMLDQ